MKTSDVPQDNSKMLGGFKKACYALAENGKYEKVASVGWEVETIVNSLANEERLKELEDIKKEVINGQSSVLKYHMKNKQMDITLLSQNTEIFKWRIKRHLKKNVFAKLNMKMLSKYANALGLTIEELKILPEDKDK